MANHFKACLWTACLSPDSPDHGSDYPGSLSKRWHGFVHQRVRLDKVQHLIREWVGGIELGSLNCTATGSGDNREFIKRSEENLCDMRRLGNHILLKDSIDCLTHRLLFSITDLVPKDTFWFYMHQNLSAFFEYYKSFTHKHINNWEQHLPTEGKKK